jgi:hypothetical protein
MQPLLCHDLIADYRSEIASGRQIPPMIGADILRDDLIRYASVYAVMHKMTTADILDLADQMREP